MLLLAVWAYKLSLLTADLMLYIQLSMEGSGSWCCITSYVRRPFFTIYSRGWAKAGYNRYWSTYKITIITSKLIVNAKSLSESYNRHISTCNWNYRYILPLQPLDDLWALAYRAHHARWFWRIHHRHLEWSAPIQLKLSTRQYWTTTFLSLSPNERRHNCKLRHVIYRRGTGKCN